MRANRNVLSNLALAGLVLLPFSAVAHASGIPAEAGFHAEGETAQIEVHFPKPVSVVSTTSEREILFQFDQAVEVPDNAFTSTEAREWVAWISSGFDTLLIHSARPVAYRVITHDSSLTIEMSALPEAAVEQDRARVALLKARVLQAEGNIEAAADLISGAADQFPADAQLLATLADLKLQKNQWRSADSLYTKAVGLQPRNEDLRDALSKISTDRSPSAKLQSEVRTIKGDRSERISSIEAAWRSHGPTSFGISFAQNDVRRSIQQFATRKVDLSLQHEFNNGSVVSGVLHNNMHHWGNSVSYAVPDWHGVTKIEVQTYRPFWDSIELLQQYGGRDRLAVSRSHRFTRRLAFRSDAAFSRYRVDGTVKARTLGVDGGVTFALSQSERAVELEYMMDVERKMSQPLTSDFPFQSREVHSGGLSLGQKIGRNGQFSASSGITRDRAMRSFAPYVAGRFAQDLGQHFVCELWFEHRQNSMATAQSANRFGAQITMRLSDREARHQ